MPRFWASASYGQLFVMGTVTGNVMFFWPPILPMSLFSGCNSCNYDDMYWEIILIYIYILPTKSECFFCGASKVGRDVRWIATTSLPTQYIGKSYQPTSNHKESSAGCWIIGDVKNLCPWTLTKSKHWSSDAFFLHLAREAFPYCCANGFILFFLDKDMFSYWCVLRREWGLLAWLLVMM